MPNPNELRVVYVVDKSDSMRPLVSETISGYNSSVDSYKNMKENVVVSLYLFNDSVSRLPDNVAKNADILSEHNYTPTGWTALLDALGRSITEVGAELALMQEEFRPGRVVFVIITDGKENASKQYTHAQIKEMIQHQTEKYNWDFLFLAANIDVKETATALSIPNWAEFEYDTQGVQKLYSRVSSYVTTGELDPDAWDGKVIGYSD